jgi:hypothetical protein
MGPLEQAKSELIRQFETLVTTDQQPAIARLQTKMKLGVDLLAWMKGQLVYPQFYLRFRDEAKTVAAVGKVRSFSDVNLAQQFIQEYDFPLVGGLQFQGESQFILPQVLIEQQHGETVVSVFVETNELDSAKAVLNSFEKTTALLPLNQLTIESMVPKANQETWCDWVNQALARIRQGELTKLVLANETVFGLHSKLNGKDFLAASQAKNSGCYHFLWADNADEIYDKILYDGAIHHHIAALAPDVLTITFNGLSKAYRVAGFRQGWMILNGPKQHAKGYIEGLDMLASMRLCANVPMQHAIQTALGGYQSINEFVQPGGRLLEQRNKAYDLITQIPGISCVKPMGAMYMFPKLDIQKFNIHSDEKFVLDLLRKEKVLLVHGKGFNWHSPDHFRVVTLPYTGQLEEAIGKLARFLETYRQ